MCLFSGHIGCCSLIPHFSSESKDSNDHLGYEYIGRGQDASDSLDDCFLDYLSQTDSSFNEKTFSEL